MKAGQITSNPLIHVESVFGSVVAGAFQITFRAKMHANDVFSFFKNYFWHQHIKTIQNVQTILNFNKKNNQIFWERSRSRVPKRCLNLKVEQDVMIFSPRYVSFICMYICYMCPRYNCHIDLITNLKKDY